MDKVGVKKQALESHNKILVKKVKDKPFQNQLTFGLLIMVYLMT
jgi:hypothetical protein